MPSSDLAISAGRGKNIPRRGLGHDTLLGLAQSQRRTLAYVAGFTLTSGTAGAYAEQTFLLNSTFNVNGGTPAIGFAKYMAFYSKAFVLGARVKIVGALQPLNAAVMVVGCSVSTNATSFLGFAAAIENGMCDYQVANTNPDRVVLNNAVDVAKFLNKPRVLDDPQLYCTALANPAQLIVLHVFLQDLLTVTTSFDYVVEIEFDVVFTDPIPFT